MLVRSGQKNLDEIQRIRVAMEGNKPVITGAQQELIVKYADILGEDGKAMIEVIEEEARKSDKLPADVFRLIESCPELPWAEGKETKPVRRGDEAERA
jgi:hypothetical protein